MKKLVIIILSSIISFITTVSMNVNIPNEIEEINSTQELVSEVIEVENKDNSVEIISEICDNVEVENVNIIEDKIEDKPIIKNEVKETAKTQIHNDTSNVVKDIPKQEVAEVKKEVQVVTENKVDTKPKEEPKAVEQPKVEEQPKPVVQQKDVEEYKVNQEMINKITSIINNNQTEDMKNFGYQIVVDSSITSMTSQFTFTEKRVKDKIAWKFGTIKVYARDYYRNGNYVWTECYII